ncbi:MAG: hypothetical protein IJU42_01650 [Erysipelotrichaceae bacterium]|nr:hypothetical protein [Erysipelotrichaceae bacterium]
MYYHNVERCRNICGSQEKSIEQLIEEAEENDNIETLNIVVIRNDR